MMDGSLKEDMKTPATYEYNVDVTKRVVDMAHCLRRFGGRRTGLPGFARNRHGR